MKILKPLFLVLYPVTLLSLLIESYTFKYFLYKHFYINSDILTAIVFVLIIFILRSPRDKIIKFYLLISSISVVVITAFYFFLTFIDDYNYQNYSFSKYHIQPDLLLRPIILGLFFLVAYYIEKKIKVFNRKKSFLSSLLFVTVVIFGISNLFLDVSNLHQSLVTVIKTVNLKNSTKYSYIMRTQYGYYYDYIEFVKSIVPANASILLPPQKNPWQFEGNQRLDRFFLYPRTLYSTGEPDLPGTYDYILIAWGNSAFPPATGDSYGWPQYKVQAKEVYIYDINSNNYKIYKGDYDPKEYLKNDAYGLIKIK